jgi:hypothetical protein
LCTTPNHPKKNCTCDFEPDSLIKEFLGVRNKDELFNDMTGADK